MKFGLIICNVSQKDPKFLKQVDAYIKAFAKIHVKLIKATNAEYEQYLKDRKNIKFVLFYDKDITLAKFFEQIGIPVYNSAETIRLCDDKGLTYLALKKQRIPMPKTYLLPYTMGKNLLEYYDEVQHYFAKLSYPFIVKERVGSFGDQVYLVNDEEELKKLLEKCGDKPLLIQEYISCSKGRDVRAFVVGKKVKAAAERINENDFRSNVNQGGTMHKYKKIKKIKKIAVKATKILGADFAGVDIVFDSKKNPLIIEVNSNPRTESIKEATKYDVALAVAKYIKKRNKRR